MKLLSVCTLFEQFLNNFDLATLLDPLCFGGGQGRTYFCLRCWFRIVLAKCPQRFDRPNRPFCRLCLNKQGLDRIFGGGITDLAEKIYDITALELADINGMPSLICDLCRSQVLVSHQFVLQCRVSD
ncbi:uncharacterized protein LOC119766063 [Culex quinquefasciatus]|uniref:uncharacterized protein LOC119766063 n=1 Tax=Culex quinquefasciatus TaxID=7176 RepID=UPI0018E2DDC1|nr:uncharacterized protein LOC119766063 [Culex quinquefasciatus]